MNSARQMGAAEDGGGVTRAGRYTSAYYESIALRKHPEFILDDWIERTVLRPSGVRINESNETIAFWGYITEINGYIGVVLRERDGNLVNRFIDSKEAKRQRQS